MYTRISIIQQGAVCEVAGDYSTEVKRYLEFLKGQHDIVPSRRVKGIPDIQSDDGTHPLCASGATECRFSQADDSADSVDCRSGLSETELIVG